MMHSLDFLMHRLLKTYFAKISEAKMITSSVDGLKSLDCEQILKYVQLVPHLICLC